MESVPAVHQVRILRNHDPPVPAIINEAFKLPLEIAEKLSAHYMFSYID